MARIRTPDNTKRRPSKTGEGRSLRERFLTFIVLALLFWTTIGPFGLFRLYRLKGERDHLLKEQIQSTQRIKALREQLSMLKTDRRLQERLVKSELGWVRDNEILYIFHNRRK